MGTETNQVNYMDLHAFIQEGYLQEANRRFFHPLGLALELTLETNELRVWDCRHDPEGIRFEGIDLYPKANNISREQTERYEARRSALGYWTQPVED